MHRALHSLGRPRSLAAAGRLALAPPLVLLVTGCAGGPLDPKGPVADNLKIILIDSTVIMLAIVIPTMIAAGALAWWYRASNARANYHPDWAYSGRIELIVWAIPLLTILFIAGVIWVGSHKLDPANPLSKTPPEEVQVVSMDWKWLFIYPNEGIATVNQLVIPVGRPVHFKLTSGSVMNVFFVPQLGSMIYTMNSMVTELHLQADHTGAFYGRSAQFSGDGFPDMHFWVHSVPEDEFSAWAAQVRAAGPVLDMPAYAELLKQSKDVKPFSYRAVDPGLFNAITMRMAPLGPGPQTGRGGVGVSPRSAG